MKSPLLVFKLTVFTWFCAFGLQATVRYVKPGSASTAWLSKTNVYSDLQAALTAAVSGDDIWLAAGTYKPTAGTDRSICFNLKNGVSLYGGFIGNETFLSQRNWAINQTILSGDIGVAGTKTDNSYRVMKGIGTDASPITNSTRIDGLIIENGYADGTNDYSGGAIYLEYATPLMVNLIIRNNYAHSGGGAVCVRKRAAEFYNVLFAHNFAKFDGGAVYSIDLELKFSHCTFVSNSTDGEGGAVACFNKYPKITNCIAWDNSAKRGESQFTHSDCTYSCVQGGLSGVGNISTDPLMIDMANGDYRLNANSPCVDKGSAANTPVWLTTDLFGASRNVGASVDMGVFEGGVNIPSILTPANKTLLASLTTSTILSWEWLKDKPGDVTGYEVEVHKNGDPSIYYTTSMLSYTLSGLSLGSCYQWRVRAVDGTSLKNWTPWFLFAVPRSTPIYVKSGASGDGSSWANALGSIQAANNIANYGESIWVAAGTYYPTTLADRTISIALKDGVSLYGGFAGTETSITERSWTKNPTILSGDIGVANDNSDNSNHIVTAIGSATNTIGSDTRIDGFIIENANCNTNPVRSGGAILINNASPTIVNVLARNNYASGYGGAISAFNSNSLIANCIFTMNKASGDGGAVYSDSQIRVVHCTFYKNTALFGGAISGASGRNIEVINSILWGNTAWSPYYMQENYTDITYTCSQGGGNYSYNINSDPLMNDADNGDFRLTSLSPCLNKGLNSATPAWLLTDFKGNARMAGTSVDMGAYEGYVVTPIGTSPANNTVISTDATSVNLQWEWKETAPAGITGYEVEMVANGGTSVFYLASSTSLNFTDLSVVTSFKWRVRAIYGAPFKEWSPWSTFNIPRTHPIYVKEGASGTGESWASPLGSLQDAITLAMVGDTIWVAAGTYKPTTTDDRTISFELKEGVVIGGGFAGSETKWSVRNWGINHTILSGDIGVENDATDNCYHVVNCQGTAANPMTNKTQLNGVIIENGYADIAYTYKGGGIYLNYASPELTNLIIRNNYAVYGGGVYSVDGTALFSNCLLLNNRAGQEGGAVYTYSEITFNHSLFNGNRAEKSGGAVYANEKFNVINSIAWGNSSGVHSNTFYGTYVQCAYSCIEGGSVGTGNISANPLWMDAAGGDFRLRSNSPCIDKGSSSVLTADFYGNARLAGSVVDMGVFEGGVIVPIIKSPLNHAIVNPLSASVKLEWGWETALPGDITGYEVEIVANGSSSTFISTTTMSVDYDGVQPATSYQWRVRGINGSVYKDWSTWSTFSAPHTHPIYVKEGGTGDGSSWAMAYGDLQSAIDGSLAGDAIWVAKGTYKPTTGTDRTISFSMKDGVAIYGGFTGTETKLEERNWVVNPTILSGDIGAADTDSDNSYHVVKAIGTSDAPMGQQTRVDGFLIEKGFADGTDYSHQCGAGIYLSHANPLMCNVLIWRNYAVNDGAGFFAQNSTSSFQNCQFIGNNASRYGGAAFTTSATSFSHCLFFNNYAKYEGRAIYSNVAFSLTNSIVWGNTSSGRYNPLVRAECANCCIEDGFIGTDIISANPLFVDASAGDFRLLSTSPCIDKGLNSATPVGLETDYLGSARLKGLIVDMGPYEGGVIVPLTKLPLKDAIISPVATSVHLEWGWETTVPSGIIGYEVEIVPNGGSSTLISVTNMSADFEGLQPATSYQWRVRGSNGSIFKDWSSWSTFSVPHNHPIYVKEGGTGDGSSWAMAYGDLQLAIDGSLAGDAIWVAKGTYKPTTGTDRTISFSLKDGVAIYGGFTGTETKLEERHWVVNPTILSGDIGEIGSDADNSYHVLAAVGTAILPISKNARIDGVIVEKGHSNIGGGGLYLSYASPTIVNSLFRNNFANFGGGAVYAANSNSFFANTLFISNTANSSGGGVFTESALSISHCTFVNNRTESTGGAVYENKPSSITNCIVWGNSAKDYGHQLIVTNISNSCVEGGYSGAGIISANPLFVDASAGDYRLLASSPCIDKGVNSATPSWLETDFLGSARLKGSMVDIGSYEGSVIVPITKYPLKNGVVSPDAASVKLEWGWETSSPADITGYEVEMVVNGGSSTFISTTTMSVDYNGVQPTTSYQWRVRGINGSAYKDWSALSTFSVPHSHPIYVKEGGTGDGSSWAMAYGDLQSAIDESIAGDAIWVAKGTYKPTTGTDRTISFSLKEGVAIYGGFAGNETNLEERNWVTNPTILSGDIGAADTDNDNSYHVVKAIGTSDAPIGQQTRVDGFLIKKGFADGADYAHRCGAGIYLSDANPLMCNMVISSNYAVSDGGGVFAQNSTSLFQNCQFIGNNASRYGGAACTTSATSFSHCLIFNNYATYDGRAIYGKVAFNLTNSIVWGNTSSGNYSLFVYAQCTNCCIEGGYSGTNVISANPLFVDPSVGDYRLLASSPCIDKGLNSATPAGLETDFLGSARLKGTIVDIGPYEGGVIVPITKAPLKNGVVSPDAASVKLEWGWETAVPGDITGYEVEIVANGGSSILISATTMFTDFDGLQPATSYQWRVRSIGVSIDKDWSSWSTFVVPHNHPIYVQEGGSGDGTSWAMAYGDLQLAINKALYGDSIWMAKGTYKPTAGIDRTISFCLKDGVAIYGGFAGNELKLSDRNWVVNQTILSGDIGVADTDADNSYHVLSAIGTTTSPISQNTKVDGVIIEKGNANGSNYQEKHGGGIFLDNGSPVLSNLLIRNNITSNYGGGSYANNSTSSFQNCQFIGNKAKDGGAAYTGSATSYTHCLIANNYATDSGGAIYGNVSFDLTNSIVWGNTFAYGLFNWANCTNCCVEGGYFGTNMISADPLFVDATNGDFRLLATSPCINTGDKNLTPTNLLTDFNGISRFIGTAVDMGPYEGGVATPVAKLPVDNDVLLPTAKSVTLEWQWPATMPDGITGYEIEVTDENGSSDLYTSEDLIFDLTSLYSGNTYQWRVRGIDGTSYKNWSEWSSFIIPHNRPIYVKAGAVGNGSSWLGAYGDLQDAINDAYPTDTIWVAAGIYKPTLGLDRNICFKLKNGLVIYGGFAGDETALNQRNWQANPTILSGDIGTVGDDTDNSYNVVKAMGTSATPLDNTTRLDGVIIEKGYASIDGGAIYIRDANLCVVNTIIRNNYATRWGGGVYAERSSAVFANTLFVANKSYDHGGAVYNYNTSGLTFTHCTFVNNRSENNGGAMFCNYSSADVINCIAWGNSAQYEDAQLRGANCTYSCVEGGNTGTGNISNEPLFVDAANGNYRLQQASPCINGAKSVSIPAWLTTDFDLLPRSINGGRDMGAFEAAYVSSVSPGNQQAHSQSPFMGSTVKWDVDPLLSDESKKLMTCHYELWKNSAPAIIIAQGKDGGNAEVNLNPVDYGTAYQWRVGVKTAGHTYWSTPTTFYIGREKPIYVKPNGTGDGSSWANALGSVSSALDMAYPGDRIWVAAGTYKPSGAGRDAAFKLKPFVELMGGYKEGDIFRNPELNVTILSGDLGTANDDSDNAYHVINNAYTEDSPLTDAVLDGFTITGGNAGSTNGGGMLNTYANPTVRYCKFVGNKAASGGAIANISSSPSIINSLLVNNMATGKGGAIFSDVTSKPYVVNSTVANNSATTGGGWSGAGTLGNSIVYDNTGGQIEGSPEVTYTCVQGGFDGVGNVSGSPRFKDAGNGNFAIGAFSACFDKGSSDLITSDFSSFDLSFGEIRNFVAAPDMGAYELRNPDIATRVEVTQSTPTHSAQGVNYIAPIVLTFNEPVEIVEPSGVTLESGIGFADMALSDDKMTLTLTPLLNWPFGSSQKLVIANGAIRFADNINFRMVDYEVSFDVRSCEPVTVSIDTSNPTSCPGSLVTLTASITGDIQNYDWLFKESVVASNTTSFAIRKLTADSIGVYHCKVTDMCGNTAGANSEVKFVEGILKPVIIKKWNDVYLVDNSSKRFSDYQWYINGASNGLTSQYITLGSLSNGQSLYVTAIDSNTGCRSTSDIMNGSAALKSVSVYPNPVVSGQPVEVLLPVEAARTHIRLYDAQGQLKVEELIQGTDRHTFEQTHFEPGVYMMEIVEGEEKAVVKLVIQ